MITVCVPKKALGVDIDYIIYNHGVDQTRFILLGVGSGHETSLQLVISG